MTLLLRTIAVSAAALCTFTTSADVIMEVPCSECRGTEFSRDFGNHALNQTYGPNSSLFEGELIVTNPEGGWVHVDLSFILVENIISGFGDLIGLDLGIPDGRMLIETTTDNTVSDSYIIDLDMIDTMGPLQVGDNPTPHSPVNVNNNGSGSGDSSGGGSTSGGGVGAGSGSGSGGAGSGSSGGMACTSAGNGEWFCVSY